MSDIDHSSSSPTPDSPTGLLGQYDSDVTVLTVGEKTVILVGTAHISQESVELVKLIMGSFLKLTSTSFSVMMILAVASIKSLNR